MKTLARIGYRKYNRDIRARPIRDKGFRAIDLPAVGNALCLGTHGKRVGTGTWLRNRVRADQRAVAQALEILLFLLLRTMLRYRHHARQQMRTQRKREPAILAPVAKG